MEVASLPILASAEPLQQALDTLRRGHFGGVVIRRPDGDLRLATTANVRTSIWTGRRTLGEVQEAVPLLRPRLEQLSARKADLIEPHATSHVYEALLDEHDRMYGVLAAAAAHALVFSRREEDLLEFRSGPQDCYCTRYGHTNPVPPPRKPCWRCNEIVECDEP